MPVGTVDAKAEGVLDWHLPPGKRSALLEVVGRSAEDTEAVVFLEAIEDAIRFALWRGKLQPKRAEIKEALKLAAVQARAVVEALDQLPEAGKQFFRRGGTSWRLARQQAGEVWAAAERAALEAKDELSGRGDDHDDNPAILAADIAAALRQLGVPSALTRPKLNREGIETKPPFWTVTTICFQQAGFSYRDPYRHMQAALQQVSIVVDDES